MRHRRTAAAIAALAALIGGLWAGFAGGTAEAAPVFREGACPVEIANAALRPRVRCGTVAVERRPGDATSGAFDIAVLIVAPERRDPAATPTFFFHGGPGFPVLQWLGGSRGLPFQRGGDTVYFDQRGGGFSGPKLCRDVSMRQLRAMADAADFPATARAFDQGFLDCLGELKAAGLSPDLFSTAASSADAEALRQALGYERINLYGGSYGTTLAMDYAARHPERVRALVIDSVYPPDDLLQPIERSLDGSLERLYALCDADAACKAAHPDLKGEYEAAVRALDAEPLSVPAPALGGVARLSGDEFELLVHQILYDRTLYAIVPGLIRSAREGRGAPLGPVLNEMVAQYGSASALGFAGVECRDRARFHQGARPVTRGPQLIELDRVCPRWSPPGEAPRVPRNPPFPVLVMAGEVDPITPPAYAREIARRIGGTTQVLIAPGVGHGVRGERCGREAVSDFLARPGAPLVTCLGRPEPIAFVTRHARMQGLSSVLGAAQTGDWLKPALVVVPALIALLFGLLWPLGESLWQRRASPLTRGARGVAALGALSLAGFVGLTAWGVSSALASSAGVLAFGLPAAFGIVPYLPWLALAFGIAALTQWKRRDPVAWIATAALIAGFALSLWLGLAAGTA